ncbi:hypothetical protein KI387_036373, partial [Taxus chinensis]
VEINERPQKRQHTAISHSLARLTLSPSHGIPKFRKLLFHHVETVSCSDEQKGLLESVLNTREGKQLQERHKEQREDIKKSRDKQDHLRASARQKHEIDSKIARFKQVWRSRKGIAENSNDSGINELYHLYDVVHVDEEEIGINFSKQEKAKSEAALHEDQVLCNYLPLMREYLPSAVAEFEAQLCSSQTSETDGYVYDIYTLGKIGNVGEDVVTDYPLVHVEEDNDFYCVDPVESDVDSDDSNEENNPLNDYPEEESEIEEGCESKDSLDSEEWDSEDADYDASDIDEDMQWACHRRS